MSSLTRMLAVLDLFNGAQGALDADQIASGLGLTRTTGYRYLRELVQAGLLANNAGNYSLGARIIHFDYLIRQSDPLLQLGLAPLRGLVAETGGKGLLASLFDDKIVNIHEEPGERAMTLSFGRGQLLPTFRSATSRAIISVLPRQRLKRICTRHEDDPDLRALAADWKGLLRFLRIINEQGYVVSRGELDADYIGIAAPIVMPDKRPVSGTISSVTLIFHREHYALFDERTLGRKLAEAGHAIAGKLHAAAPKD